MNQEQEIIATLEEYALAYCNKDIEALMAIFATSEAITVIGTGEDELCKGQAAVRTLFLRNFSDASANKFVWNWTQIQHFDEFAVVAVSLNIHLNLPSTGNQNSNLSVPIRWTIAMKKLQSKWFWLHRHASTPATSQKEGKAYPTGR